MTTALVQQDVTKVVTLSEKQAYKTHVLRARLEQQNIRDQMAELDRERERLQSQLEVALTIEHDLMKRGQLSVEDLSSPTVSATRAKTPATADAIDKILSVTAVPLDMETIIRLVSERTGRLMQEGSIKHVLSDYARKLNWVRVKTPGTRRTAWIKSREDSAK